MGAKYSNWALYEGPIYMGANSSWEVIWTLLAVILCVVAVGACRILREADTSMPPIGA